MPANLPRTPYPRIVIVGGGFAGINLAKKLKRANEQVVLIDRNNFHTFQHLLYQVATSGLEIGSIAYPLRKMLGGSKNFYFRMADVLGVIPSENKIKTSIGTIGYDYLVLACGMKTNYFNMADVGANSLPLKSISQSVELRNTILQNFEKVLMTDDPAQKQSLLTYIIAGGGPTGVELAGALCELKHKVLPKDYPEINFREMKIILADPAPRLLAAMSVDASVAAKNDLEKLGTEIRLGTGIKSYDGRAIQMSNGEIISTSTLIWAAGVIGELPDGFDKALIMKGNRIKVDEYCCVKEYRNIFVIGDLAYFETSEYPNGLPGLAPVAIQQGSYMAYHLKRLINKQKTEPFKYLNKGSLATIGRQKAVADLPGNIHLKGFFAWLIWLFVHLMYLVGFRNRVVVLMDWFWNYISYDRRMRLIVKPFRPKSY